MDEATEGSGGPHAGGPHRASGSVELDERQRGLLSDFVERLYAANAVTNLTRVPREEFETRHLLDSWLLLEFVPPGAKVLDIGSGAGFPAWPIALARPDATVVALDSSNKSERFLRSVPLPNLALVTDRAESWGVREEFDFVTGRAVAPLGVQLELSAPPCRIGGLVVPMRTPAEREPLGRFPGSILGLELEGLEERTLPGTDVVRLFPIFRKVGATDGRYPRSWAEIRRRPLG